MLFPHSSLQFNSVFLTIFYLFADEQSFLAITKLYICSIIVKFILIYILFSPSKLLIAKAYSQHFITMLLSFLFIYLFLQSLPIVST